MYVPLDTTCITVGELSRVSEMAQSIARIDFLLGTKEFSFASCQE
jgi:hypothetical protein